MAFKSLVIVLIIFSLFGLNQCKDLFSQHDLEHPKGYERCVRKMMGEPWTLEFLCCVEDPKTCFAGFLEEACIIRCPPLKKRGPKPPLKKRAPKPRCPLLKKRGPKPPMKKRGPNAPPPHFL
ncbi:hypothetical protein YC2023_049250 [Brassica napus]|uniref:Embryo surrounding factor 1 brassicaceae domain-containing protein n=1 Tax=Brassica oleracea TaxID=3712 RepID=A0A3P6C8Q4_BRAOL|nr:unnamed protein product [Brassica oleracea]